MGEENGSLLYYSSLFFLLSSGKFIVPCLPNLLTNENGFSFTNHG